VVDINLDPPHLPKASVNSGSSRPHSYAKIAYKQIAQQKKYTGQFWLPTSDVKRNTICCESNIRPALDSHPKYQQKWVRLLVKLKRWKGPRGKKLLELN